MQHDYARIEEWVNNDLLIPLDEYVSSGVIDTTNISETSLAGGIVDDQLFGINLGNNSENFTLDADAFAEAGLELPAIDWTWADFEAIALQLHEATGKYAIDANITTEQLWKSLYMSCCDQWSYNAEGTALGYEDDQPLVEYYNMLLRLQEAGALRPYEEMIAMGDQGVEANPIVTGDAAMAYFWSNQIVATWTAAGEDRNFVMHTIPRTEGGQPQNYIKPSMFFSITSQAKQPEESAKFINWFVNSIEANEILQAERGVPVSSVVREAMAPTLGRAQAEMFRFLEVIEENNSPIRPADPAGHADVLNNVYVPEFVEPVMYGLITPEEGAAILREEANAILGG
jgi:multiple sugar transport system substrate-binding protein